MILLFTLMVSCDSSPGATLSPSQGPTALTNAGSDNPSASKPVVDFVQALNAEDYTSALKLLDEASRTRIADPDALRQAFDSARATATATHVTYALRGGLLEVGSQAVTSLVSTWQTALFSTFTVTSTLTVTLQSDEWRVIWSRDLILPGMAAGALTLSRTPQQRGSVYAADGSPLAIQSESMTIGVRRSQIQNRAEEQAMLAALSRITGLTRADIQNRYKDMPEDWFIPIADVDQGTLTANSALIAPFTAISAQPSFTRTYPQSTLAPHVVGYTGPIPTDSIQVYRQRGYAGDESVGLSGVEGYMNDVLAGSPGASLKIIQADGSVSILATKPMTPSRDVTLTISPTVQAGAQKILGTRKGAIVVMNPNDGAVLALASYPTFDNSVFVVSSKTQERLALIRDPARPLIDRASQGQYPPGSTFKMVTMAAGMSEGLTSPSDVFNDPGYWDGLGSKYRKTCWLRSGHGRITLQDGLTASCDVVFYNVGKRLDDKGPGLLADYGQQFGFGMPTGIELTGEAAGIMPNPDWKKASTGNVWTSGDTVNLAIGQGYMLATPLQVAQMTAGIASGGSLYRPHVVSAISGSGSIPPQTVGAVAVRRLPVSADGLLAIQRGMAGVTTNARIGTTTFRFADFDYYISGGRIVTGKTLDSKQRASATKLVVAGKSGTAQAPGAQDKPFAWFTAYAPADHPQVVVTVMLENAGEGSVAAAPLARQLIEAYFGLPLSPTPRDVQVTD